MGPQEESYRVNDTMRSIREIADYLREWQSPLCDERIRAIILTKLEEAELFAQRLVNNEQ